MINNTVDGWNKPASDEFHDSYKDDIRQGPLGPYISRPPIAQRVPTFEGLFGNEPKPDIEDYSVIDNFNPEYADKPEVNKALNELADYYHDNVMSDTPELRQKLDNLAKAIDITPQQALKNHQLVRDYMVLSGTLPEERKVADDYLGSRNMMAAGKIAEHYIDDFHPAFVSLLSHTLARTGSGHWSLNFNPNTFSIDADDWITTRAAKHVGNWFTGGLGNHSVVHDFLGKLRRDFGITPGYAYAPLSIPPADNPYTGQVTGTLTAYGRQIGRGVSSVGSKVKDFFTPAIDTVKGWFGFTPDATRQIEPTGFAPMEPQFDFDLDFAEPSWAQKTWNGVSNLASDAWNGASNLASTVWDGATNIASSAWDGVSNLASSAWNGASNVASAAWDGVSNLATGIWDGVKSHWDMAINQPRTHQEFGSITEQRDFGMFGKPGQSFSDFRDDREQNSTSFSDALSSISDTASDIAGGISDAVSDFGNSVADAAKDAWGGFTDAMGFTDSNDDKHEGGENGHDKDNDRSTGGSTGSNGLPDSF